MTPRREVVAGERRHVEWRVGNVPIVVSVPHGGSIVPRGAPLRSARCAVVEKDHHTMELADQLDQAFHRLTGRHLHMIVCHLDRACVDVNRRKEDAGPCDGCDMGCQLAGHSDAEDQDGGVAAQAWLDYHSFIDRAKGALHGVPLCARSNSPAEHAAESAGRVLYMDLHGQSHPEDWMEARHAWWLACASY